MVKSYYHRAKDHLQGIDRIQVKELGDILGIHHLKANEILKNLGWHRSLEEIKEKHSWRVFYYRNDQ